MKAGVPLWLSTATPWFRFSICASRLIEQVITPSQHVRAHDRVHFRQAARLEAALERSTSVVCPSACILVHIQKQCAHLLEFNRQLIMG